MIVSRLALDSVWNRPETRTPPLVRDDINTSSDISRSFPYSSRRSDNSGTKAVLHCRFPWRSKTVRFHQNLLLQLLLATATVRAIKNIYTYRYHSLFRSCFFCRTLRVQARKEALGSPRIQTQFTGDIFYSVHERVYSHLPRNPTPAGHRLILLAIGNKLPVSHWPEAAGSLTSLVQVTISIWFAARCRYNVGLSRA